MSKLKLTYYEISVRAQHIISIKRDFISSCCRKVHKGKNKHVRAGCAPCKSLLIRNTESEVNMWERSVAGTRSALWKISEARRVAGNKIAGKRTSGARGRWAHATQRNFRSLSDATAQPSPPESAAIQCAMCITSYLRKVFYLPYCWIALAANGLWFFWIRFVPFEENDLG